MLSGKMVRPSYAGRSFCLYFCVHSMFADKPISVCKVLVCSFRELPSWLAGSVYLGASPPCSRLSGFLRRFGGSWQWARLHVHRTCCLCVDTASVHYNAGNRHQRASFEAFGHMGVIPVLGDCRRCSGPQQRDTFTGETPNRSPNSHPCKYQSLWGSHQAPRPAPGFPPTSPLPIPNAQ